MSETNHAWIDAPLPSRGLFYGDKLPDGVVKIRKVTVAETALMQTGGMSGVERLSTLIRSCCQFPKGFDPDQLLLTDRMALLLYQRIHTYGPLYHFTYRCPVCGKNAKSSANLVEELNTVTPSVVEERMRDAGNADFVLAEPFDVKLPDCGKTLSVRFLRGADEAAVLRYTKRNREAAKGVLGDSPLIATIAASIVAVDGVPSPDLTQKELLVRSLTGLDEATLRIAVDQRETGIDTRLNVVCSQCSAENEIVLPMDTEFFRPTRL